MITFSYNFNSRCQNIKLEGCFPLPDQVLLPFFVCFNSGITLVVLWRASLLEISDPFQPVLDYPDTMGRWDSKTYLKHNPAGPVCHPGDYCVQAQPWG